MKQRVVPPFSSMQLTYKSPSALTLGEIEGVMEWIGGEEQEIKPLIRWLSSGRLRHCCCRTVVCVSNGDAHFPYLQMGWHAAALPCNPIVDFHFVAFHDVGRGKVGAGGVEFHESDIRSGVVSI